MGAVSVASHGLSVAVGAGLLQTRRSANSNSMVNYSTAATLTPNVLKMEMGFLQKKTGARGMGVIAMASFEAGIGIMGTKLGMMTYIEPEGKVVPVTVVGFREGNIVTQVKTAATDGYDAVQVGYRRVRDTKLTKPELGHLQKTGSIPMRHLQEFRLLSVDGFEPGQKLAFEEIFKEGDLVDVSGKSIGKGFQGTRQTYTRVVAHQ